METKATLCGVPGTLTVIPWGKNARDGKPGLFMHQKWISERRTKTIKGEKVLMHAEVCFDDNCKNGHNSFAVTGHGWYDHYKSRDWDFGGACHDMIEKVFPELKHLIKWHLMSSDSPLHYVANTVYHASNRDHRGMIKGEPNQWETRLRFPALPTLTFGIKPTLALALQEAKSTKHVPGVLDLVEVPYVKTAGGSDYQFDPHYTFGCYPVKAWHEAPYKSKGEALEWQTTFLTNDWELVHIVTGYAKGKERDFDAARSTGIWPDATDEQLSLPKDELTALLEARLPQMVADFKAAIESTGCFTWEPIKEEDR